MNLPSMLVPLRFFISVTLIALSTAPAWAQARSADLISDRQLATLGLSNHWYSHISLNPSRDRIANIAIADDRLYVQTSRGFLESIDAETGRRVWTTPVGKADRVSYPAATNSFGVYVVNGTRLYALDKMSGRLQWSAAILAAPSAAPAATQHFVYVPALDGRLYAYDIERQRLSWFYHAGGRIDVPALATHGLVAFASRNSRLYVTSQTDRQLMFEYMTDAPVSAALSSMGPWLFVPSQDHNVYCVNIQNGQTRWRHALGYPFNEAPTVIGDKLYVTLFRGGMYQLNAENRDEDWFSPQPSNFLSASHERMYATDKSDRLLALDRSNGSVLGSIPIGTFKHRVRNERTDRIYLASEFGLLVCLRQRDLTHPVYLQKEDNEPILPEFATEVGRTALESPRP